MALIKEFDPFLQKYNPPSHTTSLSPMTQNKMKECYPQEIIDVIISEMTKSGMYAIMAYETRDGQTEKLAVCV